MQNLSKRLLISVPSFILGYAYGIYEVYMTLKEDDGGRNVLNELGLVHFPRGLYHFIVGKMLHNHKYNSGDTGFVIFAFAASSFFILPPLYGFVSQYAALRFAGRTHKWFNTKNI